jgi:DNA-binding response OmpR family regulator
MSKHVMIVEDHIEIQTMLQAQLELAGYTSCLARDGLEALELLQTETPSVLLLDLGLPRMDGYAFLERLAERGLPVSLAIIVLTADQNARARLADLGVIVLLKPCPLRHLVATIRQYV